ncbi:hypothetical protein [Alienimonas californiensis]|uniref:Carboxypeptidase regulatory-like domain-containing protein n=1 Tax=Alienimonas californiensis TaxID=2527989 RepID=A0A517P9L6_9PLAN|nr:hypothetical protein [Alienimonas californiensis]QDT16062.1 hypothetical protein CA12_21600 [Alienimonas californiensis]
MSCRLLVLKTPSAAFAAVLWLTAAGCGGGQPSSLEGTVFVDGAPARAGISMSFTPVGPGSPSYATTDGQGRYEAMFTFREAGVGTGPHRVALMPGGTGDGPMPVLGPDGQPVPGSQSVGPPKFPRSYYEEIQVIEIQPGGNEIDIQLETAD